MSKIILKNSVLSRLSKVCENKFPIRFEICKGKIYAIACNDSVGIVEHLGNTNQTDDLCHLIIDIKTAEQLKESLYDDTDVVIETIPEIATGSLTFGEFLNTSCFVWPESSPLENWKDWIVPNERVSKGFMFWNIYQVQKLFECSPSGEIVFPETFDSSKPVLIRDVNDSDWVGFFIPKANTKRIVKSAEKPDWWIK